jgi:hypothetical protein
LEQAALHRFPRRAQAQAVEYPHADIIFPVFDNDGNIDPIPMDIDEDDDLSDLPDLLTDAEIEAQERQSFEDDLLEDYQANMCELHYLEEALEDGARVVELRRLIAEYEMRQRT